jgi:multiple antibiotic resistance protein
MLHELTKTVLLIFASLFPIINPPAAAFIILSMVPHATPAERAELARRIAINSFVILLASLSVGAYLLSFLGISIAVLRVAGGFIIAMAGWNLLQSSGDDSSEAQPEAGTGGDPTLRIKAFYPFTLPVTVGPGSISVAISSVWVLLWDCFASAFTCACASPGTWSGCWGRQARRWRCVSSPSRSFVLVYRSCGLVCPIC